MLRNFSGIFCSRIKKFCLCITGSITGRKLRILGSSFRKSFLRILIRISS